MKRVLLSLIIILSALAAGAQFRYGPAVGVNFSHLRFKQKLITHHERLGYDAGVQAEMMFPGIGFGLGLGLMYQQTSASLNLGDKLIWASQGYGKESSMIHNLQLPIHLRFKYTRLNGFEDHLAPLVFGGPTFDIQVGHSPIKAIRYSGGDVGLTLGVGAEIKRNWQLTGSYTWALTYAMKTRLLTDYSARCSHWDIRLAYYF